LTNGLVVQWIVQEFPKLQIQVRFPARPPTIAYEIRIKKAQKCSLFNSHVAIIIYRS